MQVRLEESSLERLRRQQVIPPEEGQSLLDSRLAEELRRIERVVEGEDGAPAIIIRLELLIEDQSRIPQGLAVGLREPMIEDRLPEEGGQLQRELRGLRRGARERVLQEFMREMQRDEERTSRLRERGWPGVVGGFFQQERNLARAHLVIRNQRRRPKGNRPPEGAAQERGPCMRQHRG